jgi:hypothetical protein
MNGKSKLVISSLFILGFIAGKINQKKFIDNKNIKSQTINTQQYLNRLSEFFIDDLSNAKEDFFELLDMGFNPSDCFEITIAKSSLI